MQSERPGDSPCAAVQPADALQLKIPCAEGKEADQRGRNTWRTAPWFCVEAARKRIRPRLCRHRDRSPADLDGRMSLPAAIQTFPRRGLWFAHSWPPARLGPDVTVET